MAEEQEQQRREDHWKELAALLGIESESQARSAQPAAPAKPSKPVPEARREEPRRVAPEPRYEPEPPPREPAPSLDRIDATHENPAADSADAPTDKGERQDEQAREADEGRGRRGGRRRRGRGGDRKDDSRHKPYPRRRDEEPAAASAPAAPRTGSAPGFDEPVDNADLDDERMEVPPPRARRSEDRFAADEPEEAADADVSDVSDADDMLDQPIPVDDDDEIDEEDAPAEWNVVTWSELIASLKRF